MDVPDAELLGEALELLLRRRAAGDGRELHSRDIGGMRQEVRHDLTGTQHGESHECPLLDHIAADLLRPRPTQYSVRGRR